MADLGTDAGQATLNLSTKALELLAKLLDKIFKFIENHPARKKAKLEYKVAKSKHSRELALKKIEGKIGMTTQKKMKATGKPLWNVEAILSKEDMKLFSELAKRYDLTFAGLKINGSDKKELQIFKEDIDKFERVLARLHNEKYLNKIHEELKKLEDKGYDNLTPEEKEKYDGLKALMENHIDQEIEKFNEEMNDSILKDAVLDEEGNLKKMDLEEGLNRLTGYNLSKPDSGDFVIADAINPGNYIKVHGFDDTFTNEKGQEINYVRSQYEVYKNNELVKSFDDKRYQGRPKGYWNSIREEMNNLLDKPKYFYKFKTEDRYKIWAEDVIRQNEQELNNNTIESLKEELKNKGFDYKNENPVLAHNEAAKDGTVIPEGQAIDREFIKKIIGQSNLTTTEQKLDFKEAFLIGQTIESLDRVNSLDEQLGNKNAEIIVEDNPEKKSVLEKEYAELEKQLKAEKDNIVAIKNERKKINAAQAERNVANGRNKDEHTRDDRDEHINENEQTYSQQTLDEVKDGVAKERAKQEAAKNNDMGQKNQSIEHAAAAKDTVGRER